MSPRYLKLFLVRIQSTLHFVEIECVLYANEPLNPTKSSCFIQNGFLFQSAHKMRRLNEAI